MLIVINVVMVFISHFFPFLDYLFIYFVKVKVQYFTEISKSCDLSCKLASSHSPVSCQRIDILTGRNHLYSLSFNIYTYKTYVYLLPLYFQYHFFIYIRNSIDTSQKIKIIKRSIFPFFLKTYKIRDQPTIILIPRKNSGYFLKILGKILGPVRPHFSTLRRIDEINEK